MSNGLFRKKTVEKISSPEDLNSYLRITNPPIWIALAAAFILLFGALTWAVVGKVETKINGVCVSRDGSAVCYCPQSDGSDISVGTEIYIDDKSYTVVGISDTPVSADDVLSGYAMSLGGFSNGEYVYELTVDCSLPDGNYLCKIVTESISPIKFLTDGDD